MCSLGGVFALLLVHRNLGGVRGAVFLVEPQSGGWAGQFASWCFEASRKCSMSHLLGPALILIFAASQALRDVYFAHLFQGLDFRFVILFAFGLTIVVCGVLATLRRPKDFKRMRSQMTTIVWMNLTTALAWTSYFFSLKYVQPSIVNTLHSGMGPLVLALLSALRLDIARPQRPAPAEIACFCGIAASLAWLIVVGATGTSGLTSADSVGATLALVSPLVSGVSITISLLLARRLNEHAIGVDGVSTVRYIAIVVLTLAWLGLQPDVAPATTMSWRDWFMLAVSAGLLVSLPLYVMQMGTERVRPLTAHVLRALGPAFVFALELFDGRIAYSGVVLIGIAFYSFFAIASNLVGLWARRREEM